MIPRKKLEKILLAVLAIPMYGSIFVHVLAAGPADTLPVAQQEPPVLARPAPPRKDRELELALARIQRFGSVSLPLSRHLPPARPEGASDATGVSPLTETDLQLIGQFEVLLRSRARPLTDRPPALAALLMDGDLDDREMSYFFLLSESDQEALLAAARRKGVKAYAQRLHALEDQIFAIVIARRDGRGGSPSAVTDF